MQNVRHDTNLFDRDDAHSPDVKETVEEVAPGVEGDARLVGEQALQQVVLRAKLLQDQVVHEHHRL